MRGKVCHAALDVALGPMKVVLFSAVARCDAVVIGFFGGRRRQMAFESSCKQAASRLQGSNCSERVMKA